MISREKRSWLLLLALTLMAAIAADYGVFVWRQRHGDVASFTSVKQYVAISDGNGRWHYVYFGDIDVPCVMALLPHERRSPCWWVNLRSDHWQ